MKDQRNVGTWFVALNTLGHLGSIFTIVGISGWALVTIILARLPARVSIAWLPVAAAVGFMIAIGGRWIIGRRARSGATEGDTSTDEAEPGPAVNERRRPPGRPLHEFYELPEHRRWERVFTIHGIDWNCEIRNGIILGGVLNPECPRCHDHMQLLPADDEGQISTVARCHNGKCNFRAEIDGHPHDVIAAATQEIESELRRELKL